MPGVDSIGVDSIGAIPGDEFVIDAPSLIIGSVAAEAVSVMTTTAAIAGNFTVKGVKSAAIFSTKIVWRAYAV